ncbi:unnamed protein product, partial [Rotaria sordida]
MTQYETDKSTDCKAVEALLKTLTELLICLIMMPFNSNTLVSCTFRNELVQLFSCIIICGRQKNCLRITPLNVATIKSATLPMTIKRKPTSSIPQGFET